MSTMIPPKFTAQHQRLMKFHRFILSVAFGLIVPRTFAEPTSTNSFAIYLFAQSADWRESGSNWTNRALSPNPVISERDIVAYTFTNHLVTLTSEAAQRISHLSLDHLIESFVVVANRERVYRGAFVSSFCSQSIALPAITLWGSQQFTMSTNLPPNSLFIERTYAAPFSRTDPDPRSDPRIRRTLERLGKLK